MNLNVILILIKHNPFYQIFQFSSKTIMSFQFKENIRSSFNVRQHSRQKTLSLSKPSQFNYKPKQASSKILPSNSSVKIKIISSKAKPNMIKNSDINKENNSSLLKNENESFSTKQTYQIHFIQRESNQPRKSQLYNDEKKMTLSQKIHRNLSVLDNRQMNSLNIANSTSKRQQHRHSQIITFQRKQQLKMGNLNDFRKKLVQTPKNEVGTQTDKVQFERDSYHEFLKFKTSKQKSFQKFQNLFNFIQKLTNLQQQNFDHNIKQLKQIIQKEQVIDDREKRVKDLIQNLPISFNNLTSEFNKFFEDQTLIVKQILKREKNNMGKSEQLLKQIEKKFQALLCEKQILKQSVTFSQIKTVIQQANKKNTFIFQQCSDFLYKKNLEFQQNLSYLIKSFDYFCNKIIQQQTLIKSCVQSISQLPELCLSIFGMENINNPNCGILQIKRFGVDIQDLPCLTDFFVKKDHKNIKQIDQAFSKCCDIKCMNCVYLKSKMNYIHRKNIELKPILKILLYLTNWKNQSFMSLR